MNKSTRPTERWAKRLNSTGSAQINARITARFVRTSDGETHREYVVDGISVGSIEGVKKVVKSKAVRHL